MTQELKVTIDTITSPKRNIWDEIKVGEFFVYYYWGNLTPILYRKISANLADRDYDEPNALTVLNNEKGFIMEMHTNGHVGVVKKIKKIEFLVTVEE